MPGPQTIITAGEVVRYSPESSKFPPQAVQPHIFRKERAFVRAFLGHDFYQLLLADLEDVTELQAWSPLAQYNTGDVVDYFGMTLKSLVDNNSVNPCEDPGATNWELMRKFQSECFENLWQQGLREHLAYTIMASAIDHTTFPAGARGVVEWVDDASSSRSASNSTFFARKNKLLSDASEALENLKEWIYREHTDTESVCDFSEMLWLKGCTTKPGIHRARRFHFQNKRTQRRQW